MLRHCPYFCFNSPCILLHSLTGYSPLISAHVGRKKEKKNSTEDFRYTLCIIVVINQLSRRYAEDSYGSVNPGSRWGFFRVKNPNTFMCHYYPKRNWVYDGQLLLVTLLHAGRDMLKDVRSKLSSGQRWYQAMRSAANHSLPPTRHDRIDEEVKKKKKNHAVQTSDVARGVAKIISWYEINSPFFF